MKAICLDYDEGDCFPYLELNQNEFVYGQYLPCDRTLYKCFQPDYWDDEEFNMIILLEDRPVRVRGIHFDFKN